MIDVLLAAPGVTREPELVSTASTAGVRIVRRCVDAVDVLAAVASFPQAQPVISASLPRLVSATVDRLGSATVGLAEDPEDVDRLRHLGVSRIVRADSTPLWPLLIAAREVDDIAGSVLQIIDTPPPARCGLVIVVWGPHGAPGRTTVALGLADALAGMQRRVCLIDADTYAPSIGIALGVQAPGILAACRSVDGRDETDIAAFCAQVSPSLSVLTGIGSTEQWPELRSANLESLWESVRANFDVTPATWPTTWWWWHAALLMGPLGWRAHGQTFPRVRHGPLCTRVRGEVRPRGWTPCDLWESMLPRWLSPTTSGPWRDVGRMGARSRSAPADRGSAERCVRWPARSWETDDPRLTREARCRVD